MNIRNSQGRADEEMMLFLGWLLVKKKHGMSGRGNTFQKMILRAPVEVGSLSHYLRRVLYIPGGAGFLPSTVGLKHFQ